MRSLAFLALTTATFMTVLAPYEPTATQAQGHHENRGGQSRAYVFVNSTDSTGTTTELGDRHQPARARTATAGSPTRCTPAAIVPWTPAAQAQQLRALAKSIISASSTKMLALRPPPAKPSPRLARRHVRRPALEAQNGPRRTPTTSRRSRRRLGSLPVVGAKSVFRCPSTNSRRR